MLLTKTKSSRNLAGRRDFNEDENTPITVQQEQITIELL